MSTILIVLMLLGFGPKPVLDTSNLNVMYALKAQEAGYGTVLDNSGCYYELLEHSLHAVCLSIGGFVDEQGNTQIIGTATETTTLLHDVDIFRIERMMMK